MKWHKQRQQVFIGSKNHKELRQRLLVMDRQQRWNRDRLGQHWVSKQGKTFGKLAEDIMPMWTCNPNTVADCRCLIFCHENDVIVKIIMSSYNGTNYTNKHIFANTQTANIPSITYRRLHQVDSAPKKVLKETFSLQLGLCCLNPQASGQTVVLLVCVKAVVKGWKQCVITLKVTDHKKTMTTPNCQIDSSKQIFLSWGTPEGLMPCSSSTAKSCTHTLCVLTASLMGDLDCLVLFHFPVTPAAPACRIPLIADAYLTWTKL